MRKSEENGPYFWGFQLPILRLTYLESSRNFRKFGINKKDGYFFRLDGSSGPMWSGTSAGLAPHLLWKQWWRFAVSRVSLVTVMELVLRWNGGEKRKQLYHHYWWCCINLIRYCYFCNNILQAKLHPRCDQFPDCSDFSDEEGCQVCEPLHGAINALNSISFRNCK